MKKTIVLALLFCCTMTVWGIGKFNLVPVYGNAYWTDSLSADMRNSYIRAAEQQLGKPWMNTNIALFSLYRAEGDREKYQQFVYKKRNQLAALAMGELMEAKGRFLPEILNGLFALCEETWWGLPAHYGPNMPLPDNQSLDLFNAETAGLVAWLLYLYEETIRQFSLQLEKRIRSEINRRVIQEARKKKEWWRGAAMNWNPWICSNWIACVLFGETDAAEQEKDLKLITQSLSGFVKDYPDDGGCDEGPGYWDRAAGSLFDCMHLLDAVGYEWFNPAWEGKIHRMADYFCKVNVGNGYFVNFADAGPKIGIHLTWFPSARMLGNEELMSLIAQSAEERNFLTYPAAIYTNNYFYSLARELMLLMDVKELIRQKGTVRLHFDSWLDRIQLMTARSNPNSVEGLYMAAKGGHNGESHNHNDVGNLIVYADGKPLIIDVGVGTYRKETFNDKTRYDIWCMQSNYHNVPLINGVAQRNGKEFAARGAKATFGKKQAVFTVDIAGAYPAEAGVKKWQRTFNLSRGKQIKVTERYELEQVKGPSSIVLMTQVQPRLENGKIGLSIDGKQWAVVFDKNALNATVEQVDLNDKKFVHLWGTVYRTRLTLRSNQPKGEVSWTVLPDNKPTALGIREVKTDMDLPMQPDEKIQWMRDARIGMFIHWGLYAGPAKGEWYMRNEGISPEEYRRLAYPESGARYFDASQYRPDEWMKVAHDMGARYVNLTTEHHDGYALFESHYPNAFTSMQTHNRDFIKEYVEAARKAGLKVGLYKTLINWRYPGYYDVRGTDCKKNSFGYKTAAWHKENARIMKEELYCQTRELCSNYGKIDQIFWDGGWLAENGTDASAAFFWEPGKWTNPANEWPVNPLFAMTDSTTGRQLGLMGMVRKLQPDVVVNLRSGWCGDYTCEEGGSAVKGPIRKGVVEKCMTITKAWGYTPDAEDESKVRPLADLKRLCADCMVRDMCFLVNVGPDRHGSIPKAVAKRLRDFGQWTKANAQAIYGTRGGPWQPVDGQYGFTYSKDCIFVYFLGGYQKDSFTLPSLPDGKTIRTATVLETEKAVPFTQKKQTVTLHRLPLKKNEVTIIMLTL